MTYAGKREMLSLKRRQSLKSQIEVAARIGIAQSQYSNIENGYANPTEEQAAALIAMFDLPDNYFKKEDESDDGHEHDSKIPGRTADVSDAIV